MKLVLHSQTAQAVERFIAQPKHALALTGPAGSGKGALAEQLALRLLQAEDLEHHPGIQRLQPVNNAISIEVAREITAYLTLVMPGNAAIRRVVIVEDAHTMSAEAQNAILKAIEEPPADTVFLLTIKDTNAILPTILSRVQVITVHPPAYNELHAFFAAKGFEEAEVEKAARLSGGLPGLMHGILAHDATHPLLAAIEQSKEILRADTFTRLTMVDEIAKQKQTDDLLFAMSQIAQAALANGAAQQAADTNLKRWTTILAAVHTAQTQLQASAQHKLLLTNLFMSL